jgi:hypothetical protein
MVMPRISAGKSARNGSAGWRMAAAKTAFLKRIHTGCGLWNEREMTSFIQAQPLECGNENPLRKIHLEAANWAVCGLFLPWTDAENRPTCGLPRSVWIRDVLQCFAMFCNVF